MSLWECLFVVPEVPLEDGLAAIWEHLEEVQGHLQFAPGKWLTVLGLEIGKDFAEGHWDVKSVQPQSVSLSLKLKPCQASWKSKALWTIRIPQKV